MRINTKCILKKKKKVRNLTFSGNFIRRVEPPVSARRRADVHVEMDVVSQPVAPLFVADEYRLLPVLYPFTSAVKKKKRKKSNNKKRLMRKVAPFITASEMDFHFSIPKMKRGSGRERWTVTLSDHNLLCSCQTESCVLGKFSTHVL